MASMADRLREHAKKRGWSITELAKRAGIDRSKCSRAFSGKTTLSHDELVRLCSALDVSLTELVRDVVLAPFKRRTPVAKLYERFTARILELEHELTKAQRVSPPADDGASERENLRRMLRHHEHEMQALREDVERGIRATTELRHAKIRIDQLEADNAALRAQVARLTGDVTADVAAVCVEALLRK